MESKAKHFYTTFEAAKICQVSPGSINRWIHEGRLNSSLTAGGHHRIQAKHLTAFLNELQMPIPEELNQSHHKALFLSENKQFTKQLRQYFLNEHPDAETDEAHDYFMAGWKASRFQPDIVILDLGSCGNRALKICELMRAFFENKQIPFLVLSTEINPSLKQKIQELGSSDWILKPFVKRDFLKKMDSLLTQTVKNLMTGS